MRWGSSPSFQRPPLHPTNPRIGTNQSELLPWLRPGSRARPRSPSVTQPWKWLMQIPREPQTQTPAPQTGMRPGRARSPPDRGCRDYFTLVHDLFWFNFYTTYFTENFRKLNQVIFKKQNKETKNLCAKVFCSLPGAPPQSCLLM